MKCHYVYDPIAGKVLIPGCMAVAHSNDMARCTCRSLSTFRDFEKQRYNEILKQKDDLIKSLERDNADLNRIIKKLINKKWQN